MEQMEQIQKSDANYLLGLANVLDKSDMIYFSFLDNSKHNLLDKIQRIQIDPRLAGVIAKGLKEVIRKEGYLI